MHDIRIIRDEPDAFIAGLKRRGMADAAEVTAKLLARDKELRDLLTRLQQAQARRNEASKLIGQAKSKKDEAQASTLMAEVAGLKDEIQSGEQKERELSEALRNEIAEIPNLPDADVPDGANENDNRPVEARYFKSTRTAAGGMNAPKEHFDLGEKLGMIDFERAAKVSGARFVYLKGPLARLNRALASYMLDSHTTKFGYEEVVPPMLVKDQAMFGTGQLPKFHDDQFAAYQEPDLKAKFANERDVVRRLGAQDVFELGDPSRFWLIPTAEVPLTNYVSGEILAEAELPLRFTAFTPCFRAEAGAAGKDTRGMIRMHQFDKVELVSITMPEQSNAEHERMTDAAQEILKKLDLHHRVVTLCTGDMGFAARKTYDIEVWLPGQNRFREISSCSNCGDFQARRMNARYRGSDGKVKGPVHTLNGSGLAIGRTLIAIMENYQNPDGSISVPDALKPYMNGLDRIAK
jgi:seryl-tRNA synthetase